MTEKKKPAKVIKLDGDGTVAKEKLGGRDTVYIDTDDDVTSIIEKVKESDSSVLALVPPKRVGVLQSVVNLKLLQRAAKSSRKKIEIITTDAALVALAAGLRIPVAKNLTTQAELPAPLDFDDTDSDVINGDELAIGDLARVAEKSANARDSDEDKEISAAVAAIETDDKIKNDLDADGEPDDAPEEPRKSKKPPKAKRVPNFDSFRKKLLIFGTLGVALIVFLVWAIVFAPHGTITIAAETTPKNIEVVALLRPNAATNIAEKIVQPTIKQIKKTETIDFTATGSKDVGEKAKGDVNIYVRSASAPMTLSAGTTFASNGLQFTLDQAVTVSGNVNACSIISGAIYCSASASITASAIGSSYNIDSNTEFTIAGKGGTAYAVAKNDFTGGAKETVKVVQQSDLDLATEKLKNQGDQNKIKDDLKAQMGDDGIVLEDSFAANYGTISSKPGVDEVVTSGNGTATMEITYTLIGITKTDLKNLIGTQLGDLENQKVYNDGVSGAKFKNFTDNGGNKYSITINTTAQIGPDLDTRKNQIKEQAVGKRSGEIAQDIESIPGVSSVQVKFSPFWVSTAPAANKLTVEFTINE
jgi:hypothetical protein